MSGDGIYRDIFVKLLQGECFVVRIFFSFHDWCSEDFLSASSFFQELDPDITLHEFLLVIQKSEEGSIHQRRFTCSRRTGDDGKTSQSDFDIDVGKIIF